MIPVIMSGGSGSRLWPQSRSLYPKQFLPLVGDKTMLQETVARLEGLADVAAPIVVCNEDHRFMAAEQLRQCGHSAESIILEPVGRNTAPAIAVAALRAVEKSLAVSSKLLVKDQKKEELSGVSGKLLAEEEQDTGLPRRSAPRNDGVGGGAGLSGQKIPDNDELLLVLAADHVIEDVAAFHAAIEVAKEQALTGKLVTFGVVPTAPETGYGYIRAGAELQASSSKLQVKEQKGQASADASKDTTYSLQLKACSYSVTEFVEKPDLATAQRYIDESGGALSGEPRSHYKWLWNSGMFMFKASRYLEELGRFNPQMLVACEQALAAGSEDMDFTRLDKAAFAACPDDSIDYAVMEPLCAEGDGVAVVPLDAGWSDVGTWSALWDVSEKDSAGNVAKGDVMLHDSHNCYVQGEKKLVALVGLDDVVVVESDDAIMVSRFDRVQEVKSIVERLKAEGRPEASLHRKVFRPWGYYDSIDRGERFQTKRVVVHPGGELSLQLHLHRAEHWIVVAGTAEVTSGERVFLLKENESTYIPIGVTHRLKNPGATPLEMIEVQSGSYLGEDDIVRFEDNYGR